MKIIKTAQYNALPGDPGLPPGTTNRMIDDNAGTGEDLSRRGEQGFFPTNINWNNIIDSHLDHGYDMNLEMEKIRQMGLSSPVPVDLFYTFDFIQGNEGILFPENIKITQAVTTVGGSKINIDDEDLLFRLGEDYEEIIKKDIQEDASNLDL